MRSAVSEPAALSEERARGVSASSLAFAGMLLLGFFLRLLFVPSEGFKSDVSTFESWSLTLARHPLDQFFSTAGFADYPPGYFFVLWIVGHVYTALTHGVENYDLLKLLVKLPAILMDLVNAWLIFTLVRRYASLGWAFAAAAIFTFNPAAIFISADWGQVDSVAGAVTLGSLLLLLDADRRGGRARTLSIAGAWLLLSYSILIKPPAVVLVPLYLAYVFTTDDAAVRRARAAATAIGVAAGFVLAYAVSFAFYHAPNPIAEFAWLIGRYAFAANVYPYNSVNAFNLYVMAFNSFWQPDNVLIPNLTIAGHAAGIPQYLWGILLMLAATALVVSRYLQRREPLALLEGAMILSLGYFVLSTRMHERYIFNALLLAVPLAPYARRYLYAAFLLTFTLVANLYYSLVYLYVMDNHVSTVDATNLMPPLSHSAALINVALFFYLGYVYLGAGNDALQELELGMLRSRLTVRARAWFSPLEGIAQMTRADWWIASALTVASFVLSYVSYVWPSEKIFDEIYYARAGEEYLSHKEIFEFTHPPLTKLLITGSMLLFGGMHGGGDTSAGWRFLNLVVGALMVLVIYCFAKRLLGSTPFALVAAGLLLLDGFHYVQSRIATPEITVAFFSLLTLYAFYRFWLASRVRVAPQFVPQTLRPQAFAVAGVLVVAALFAAIVARGQDAAAHIVAFLYLTCGGYAAVRLFVPKVAGAPLMTSYADGSRVALAASPQGSAARTLVTLDAGRVPLAGGNAVPGESTTVEKSGLVYRADGVRIDYLRTGAVRYATDDGEAAFDSAGTMRVANAVVDGRRDGLVWLAFLSAAGACVAASKWNGLFDFFVVWFLAVGVVAQRYGASIRRAVGLRDAKAGPALWGNPFGISFDVLVASMLFIGATVYVLCYIPYFTLGHNLADLVGLQQQMFGYHYDLTATHPYGSKWWQWPFIGRPISYYYHDWRTGGAAQNGAACCVAEILALPNPANWWLGLVSVPFIAWLGWRERNKGYALLVVAYFLQWLPWILSPRVAFEYHFFPNLAIICLANAVLLQRLWRFGEGFSGKYPWPKVAVGGYLTLVVLLFVFFYPILAGTHITWNAWDARMLHWLVGNSWV